MPHFEASPWGEAGARSAADEGPGHAGLAAGGPSSAPVCPLGHLPPLGEGFLGGGISGRSWAAGGSFIRPYGAPPVTTQPARSAAERAGAEACRSPLAPRPPAAVVMRERSSSRERSGAGSTGVIDARRTDSHDPRTYERAARMGRPFVKAFFLLDRPRPVLFLTLSKREWGAESPGLSRPPRRGRIPSPPLISSSPARPSKASAPHTAADSSGAGWAGSSPPPRRPARRSRIPWCGCTR